MKPILIKLISILSYSIREEITSKKPVNTTNALMEKLYV